MKRFLIGLIFAALLFSGCGGDEGDDNNNDSSNTGGPGTIFILGITSDKPDIRMLKLTDDAVTENITITFVPSTLPQEERGLVWTSNNENVATVSDDGVITAIGGGTAVITVTSVATNRQGAKVFALINVRVRDTDPALFRWSADTDTAFVIGEDFERNSPRFIDWPHSEDGPVPFMVMGRPAKAVESKSGKKGYLLNWICPVLYPRDDTGAFIIYSYEGDPEDEAAKTEFELLERERRQNIRNGQTKLIIGTEDFGTYAQLIDIVDGAEVPRVDRDGNPVFGYTGLSTTNSAPEGTLNLFQRVTLTIEFSDQARGVTGGPGAGVTYDPETHFQPENSHTWQIFFLNNSSSMAQSPLGGSSRFETNPPFLGDGTGDGVHTTTFTGTNHSGVRTFLENGFISIEAGFGRQVIIRSIVIETDW
jgi:hypothetical protein